MSQGAVQPAVVTLLRPLRSEPNLVRQLNAVQPASVTIISPLFSRPNPVR